jgi:hypothetical protein
LRCNPLKLERPAAQRGFSFALGGPVQKIQTGTAAIATPAGFFFVPATGILLTGGDPTPSDEGPDSLTFAQLSRLLPYLILGSDQKARDIRERHSAGKRIL